jgi:hypothetical protein
MKKLLILSFLPLWGLGGSALASVTVTPLSVNYNARTVTFRVEYAGAANNRAWVWIDLCPVPGVAPDAFQKAVISTVSVAGGSWDNTSLNGRGFYVTANGSTVTATLDNAAGKFNWCAYGSDFPPNAVENGSSYTLKGSPPFILTTSSGTVEVNVKTYSGSTITALTDATGCPGVLCSKNGETAGLLGCCNGTTKCGSTCITTGTYTTNESTCTGACHTAYVAQRNQCSDIVDAHYSTWSNDACTAGCVPTFDYNCKANQWVAYQMADDCITCQSVCETYAAGWDIYNYGHVADGPGGFWCACYCYRCNN